MDQLLADPLCRRTLGLLGYQAYLQKWTPEAHMQGYFALIREAETARSQTGS